MTMNDIPVQNLKTVNKNQEYTNYYSLSAMSQTYA